MTTTSYAGRIFTMESFTSQTTDGSGNITVTLANTPVSDNSILINLQGVAGAFAQFSSRTGTSLTVKVYGTYDKATSVASTYGQLTNLPSGVAEYNTQVSVGYAEGGNTTALNGTSHGTGSHTHTINSEYSHGHGTINTSATAMSTLNTQAGITIIVAYAY